MIHETHAENYQIFTVPEPNKLRLEYQEEYNHDQKCICFICFKIEGLLRIKETTTEIKLTREKDKKSWKYKIGNLEGTKPSFLEVWQKFLEETKIDDSQSTFTQGKLIRGQNDEF